MHDVLFEELCASVREGGAILRRLDAAQARRSPISAVMQRVGPAERELTRAEWRRLAEWAREREERKQARLAQQQSAVVT